MQAQGSVAVHHRLACLFTITCSATASYPRSIGHNIRSRLRSEQVTQLLLLLLERRDHSDTVLGQPDSRLLAIMPRKKIVPIDQNAASTSSAAAAASTPSRRLGSSAAFERSPSPASSLGPPSSPHKPPPGQRSKQPNASVASSMPARAPSPTLSEISTSASEGGQDTAPSSNQQRLRSASPEGDELADESVKESVANNDAQVTCQWNDCGETFNSLQPFIDHLHHQHIGIHKSKYMCEWTGCIRKGKPQTSRFALLSHLRSHTGEKPFTCPRPGKSNSPI